MFKNTNHPAQNVSPVGITRKLAYDDPLLYQIALQHPEGGQLDGEIANLGNIGLALPLLLEYGLTEADVFDAQNSPVSNPIFRVLDENILRLKLLEISSSLLDSPVLDDETRDSLTFISTNTTLSFYMLYKGQLIDLPYELSANAFSVEKVDLINIFYAKFNRYPTSDDVFKFMTNEGYICDLNFQVESFSNPPYWNTSISKALVGCESATMANPDKFSIERYISDIHLLLGTAPTEPSVTYDVLPIIKGRITFENKSFICYFRRDPNTEFEFNIYYNEPVNRPFLNAVRNRYASMIDNQWEFNDADPVLDNVFDITYLEY